MSILLHFLKKALILSVTGRPERTSSFKLKFPDSNRLNHICATSYWNRIRSVNRTNIISGVRRIFTFFVNKTLKCIFFFVTYVHFAWNNWKNTGTSFLVFINCIFRMSHLMVLKPAIYIEYSQRGLITKNRFKIRKLLPRSIIFFLPNHCQNSLRSFKITLLGDYSIIARGLFNYTLYCIDM